MRVIYRFSFFSICFTLVLLSSCGINSNLMFKEAKGEVNSDSIPLVPEHDYAISVDDKISFRLSTNEGTEIIEQMAGIGLVSYEQFIQEFTVRRDGKVELPVLGKIKVAGLTIEACEDTLTVLFSHEYIEPFVQVWVTNQRAIVFPGNGSDATVVPLTNANTTLMEAIASAGGITDRGKASKVKLMRKVNGKRQVYTIDLSTIDGLKYADMIVQANDYIYVEPTADIGQGITESISPVISILSGVLLLYTSILIFK